LGRLVRVRGIGVVMVVPTPHRDDLCGYKKTASEATG
jgi:hypothetical protein